MSWLKNVEITEDWDWVDMDKQLVNTITTRTTTWLGFIRTRIKSTLIHRGYDSAKSDDRTVGFKMGGKLTSEANNTERIY